jgi:thioredoxin 1
MGTSIAVTDQSFQTEVVESPVLTIADLWADWCGPCKRLSPILDEIGQEYAGRLKIVKLDVDSNPVIPGQYEVMGIPTLLVFKGGELVETVVGYMPKDRLLSRILPHLA